MNTQTKSTSTAWKRSMQKFSAIGVMGTVLLIGAGCSQPSEQAPPKESEPILIAESDEVDEPAVEEIPLTIDYDLKAEEILALYTEEGMSRFKMNFPDTLSMEYALKNVGKELASFSGKTIEGKPFDSKQLEGKPYVLNFSKTTCPVCEEMTPIAEQFGVDEDIPVISLYPVDKTDDVKSFRKKAKANPETTVLVADKNEWLKELAIGNLDIAQVPTLIFVDESGRISYSYIGKTDDILLADMKEKAFGNEKLYDFVRTELVKHDDKGNPVGEVTVSAEEVASLKESLEEQEAADKK